VGNAGQSRCGVGSSLFTWFASSVRERTESLR
jgi:hypothetical protein